VAAVDCLDALASDRQYRRALPLDEAMKKVVAERGKSFDPRVVDLLQRRYREFEEMARKQGPEACKLSTGVKIEHGGGPAAGFEPSSAPVPARPGFIESIASAREEFQTLLELTHDLGSSLRVDETLALLASRLLPLIPHHGIAIYTVDGSRLVTRFTAGEDSALFSSLSIPLGEGISGWVAQNNKPIVNGNPSVEPGYLNDPEKFSLHRSALSVPLPGIEGVLGALTLYHRDAGAFTKDHVRVLMAVSSKAGLTIENALRFVQAEATATTDDLTELPNTRSFFRTLDSVIQEARISRNRVAVLVTDIDGFKMVNDQFGHATGNRVLQETAAVLRRACRRGDFVARMGGDEFVLLLAEADPDAISRRAADLDRLISDAGARVCGAGFLRLSAGAAYFPEDGQDAEELLAIADARMYEMKRAHHTQRSSGRDLDRLAEALAAAPAQRLVM
jgi:diguanylate cyclase (GGDEF)-like protein